MKRSVNQSLNRGDDGEKLKLHHGGPSVDHSGRGQCAFKKCLFLNRQQSPLRAYRVEDSFILLKLPIQDIFKPSRVNSG